MASGYLWSPSTIRIMWIVDESPYETFLLFLSLFFIRPRHIL